MEDHARSLETLGGFLNEAYEFRGDFTFMDQNNGQFDNAGDLKADIAHAHSANEIIIKGLIDEAREIERTRQGRLRKGRTSPTSRRLF